MFRVMWTGPNGIDGVNVDNAKQALEKYQEAQAAGFQKITIKDDGKRTLKLDEVVALSTMVKPSA
ncbi:hypothetical protein IVB46_44200 [Bradyrhizobium sp. 61]|uniref:hypothetical protein n=1 Tax=Bradyrhizobium sp. 61 TaxID=2782679 RepID=UPI001FF7D014|nr:hypothetical protein [Bradyrhizobium sp. 61]MCK1282240.1 hypothetical protein [Bradyrhizobium sp. 61]